VALHAAELGFIHPVTGEEMRFASQLPKDLKEVQKRLVKIHGQEIVEPDPEPPIC
jgi:23S rRNA pseudouridine1911/1915/1917 synthase